MGLCSIRDGGKTEISAVQAHLHQSRLGSQRPDRWPLGTAACKQPGHLGESVHGEDEMFAIVANSIEACVVLAVCNAFLKILNSVMFMHVSFYVVFFYLL